MLLPESQTVAYLMTVRLLKNPAALILGLWICAGLSGELHGQEKVRLEVFPAQVELAGMTEGRQLLVTSMDTDQRAQDLTRIATFIVANEKIVAVSAHGYVRPVARGETTIAIEAAGLKQHVRVAVKDGDDSRPLHFANDIVPLLSRHGCNAGGCHGKASGQNGFKLSLFGFDADFDYDAIVKEARGRRLFPAAPDSSLLLIKATGRVAARRRQAPRPRQRGVPDPASLDRSRARPSATPSRPTLPKLDDGPRAARARPQTRAAARGAGPLQRRHGPRRHPPGAVSEQRDRPSPPSTATAWSARFDLRRRRRRHGPLPWGRSPSSAPLVPLGKPIAEYPDFPATNYVDELALAKWKKLGLVPSRAVHRQRVPPPRHRRPVRPAADAGGGARHSSPTPSATSGPQLIDRLLDEPDYPAYFALRWGSILRNSQPRRLRAGGVRVPRLDQGHDRPQPALRRVRARHRRGRRASGRTRRPSTGTGRCATTSCTSRSPTRPRSSSACGCSAPSATIIRTSAGARTTTTAWPASSRGWAARASASRRRTTRRATRTTGEINPRTGKPLEPKLLDGPVLKFRAEEDPRHKLVDWMAKPDNPFFAKALVNRMWGHFLGRGLVDPVDDMRETQPAVEPRAARRAGEGLRQAQVRRQARLRTICNSRIYQLSASRTSSTSTTSRTTPATTARG